MEISESSSTTGSMTRVYGTLCEGVDRRRRSNTSRPRFGAPALVKPSARLVIWRRMLVAIRRLFSSM